MSIKTTLAAAAAGALLAIPVTAGAVGSTDSPQADTPCGVDGDWMLEHWNDPEHWEDMQSYMQQHWSEMGSHMSSEDFDHGPGMMGGFGMRGSTSGRSGMWQGGES